MKYSMDNGQLQGKDLTPELFVPFWMNGWEIFGNFPGN